jgi:rod shape-determining protein MreB
MFFEPKDIGIDLGTASVLVFVRGKGIVLHEPSVVAINKETKEVLAIGEEARGMIGRTPGHIVAIRPLKEGVIADYDITAKMLTRFIQKVGAKGIFSRPRIMICVPSGTTTVEKRAVKEAAAIAGAKFVRTIEEPLAAALGAGIDTTEPTGNMVVDIGGGTTDVAIISLGGIVLSESLRVGGDKFDEAIIRYVKKEFNLAIGERTAEEIKIKVGTVYPGGRDESMEARGRHLVTGLPYTITITSQHVYEALKDTVDTILALVRRILDICPPELASDIIDRGILLTGGGALLHGLDKLMAEHTMVPTHVAENCISCVAIGTGKALESLDVLSDSID